MTQPLPLLDCLGKEGSPTPATPRSRIWLVLLALALTVVIGLSVANLALFPRTWFDEGMNLVLAKNLAQVGRYVQSPASEQGISTPASTGPTVIVPISLVFKIAGVGLLQARAVMVGYILLAALGLGWVGYQLNGPAVAAVTVVAFAAATDAGPIANGRQALGEVPALAFLYLGTGVFIRAQATRKVEYYLAAGGLFGLALLTKEQFAIPVPFMLAIWFLRRRKTPDLRPRHLVALLLATATPPILWYGWQALALGPAAFAASLAQVAEVGAPARATILTRAPAAVGFLVSSGFGIWGAAGLVYTWTTLLRPSRGAGIERFLLPTFVVVWLGWYVTVSIGWPRYAIPVVVTSSLFIAQLFVDLAGSIVRPKAHDRGWLAWVQERSPSQLALLLALAMTLVTGVAINGERIARARDDTPQRFAMLVAAQVPSDATIESFEWEIDFLTDRVYHHPPASLMVDAIRVAFLGQSERALGWYQVPTETSYLVDGPFSKKTGIYRSEIERGQFERVASSGEYDLYRRIGIP